MYTNVHSQNFIEFRLDMSVDEFATWFKAFMLTRLAGVAKNNNDRCTLYQSRIRARVLEGLRKYLFAQMNVPYSVNGFNTGAVTQNKELTMHWKDYHTKLVGEYGVELIGWPLDSIATYLSLVSFGKLELCLTALRDGTCYWVKLSNEDHCDIIKEMGSNQIDKSPRQTRNDKGLKQKPHPSSDGEGSASTHQNGTLPREYEDVSVQML